VSRIVCNTGPLIALGLLGRLDLLKSLFSEVFVPEAVQREIEQGGANQSGLASFRLAGWIRVAPLRGGRDMLLESLLDTGEAAVITLAREQGIATVLLDERKARKVARDIHGLQVIGTVRVLVEAKRRGLVPEIASLFKKLRQEGYWIHDTIVQAALQEAGEIGGA
jgi:predicted nucleic acid-binding protein